MRGAVCLVVAQRRVRPADEHGEVTAFGPGARPHRVTGPSFDGEVARLEVHEQRRLGIECPEQAGFSDAGLAEDRALDAARFAATLTNIVTVLSASVVPAVQQATYTQTGGNTLVVTRTALGPTGNTFTLAASTTPASNGTVSGATLTGGANGHTFVSGTQTLPSMSIEVGLPTCRSSA